VETLNDQDVDTLTKLENRLITMRKREAANANSRMMIEEFSEAIKKIHTIRQDLQARFRMTINEDINPFRYSL